jgi:hypothetical protein
MGVLVPAAVAGIAGRSLESDRIVPQLWAGRPPIASHLMRCSQATSFVRGAATRPVLARAVTLAGGTLDAAAAGKLFSPAKE